MFSQEPSPHHHNGSSSPKNINDAPTKKSTLYDPFHSPSSTLAKTEPSHSRKGKYTGCNCSKSECLKMYCACFSVGKMCD